MQRNRPAPQNQSLRTQVLQYIAEHPQRPTKARPLARALGVADHEYADFRATLRALLDEGILTYGPGRTLVPARPAEERRNEIQGVFRATRRGFGFIETGRGPDIFVPAGRTGGARDGDTVAGRWLARRSRGGQRAAEVAKIIRRAPVRWVGVLERVGRHWRVQPRGVAGMPPVLVDSLGDTDAAAGDLVLVEPVGDFSDVRDVRGVVTERLGAADSAAAIVLGVIRTNDLPEHFPSSVLRAAERIADTDPAQTADQREDLRDLLTITIDPRDARDFDDAISLRRGRDGMELGVHIADVAHYVQPGDPIDEEARRRGTSVYFPGRVLPMLPETLSNGLCSLQPDQPRLTRSVFITYDAEGRVRQARFCNAIIRSDARLTYEQASAVLDGDAAGVPRAVATLLRNAGLLAKRIRKRRLQAGMLSLTLPEVEIEIGRDGRVRDARPADTSFSHTLIEMFMVEANEAVSGLLARLGAAHLRRVHPPIEPDAMERLSRVAAAAGVRLPKRVDRGGIQTLLDQVRGKPAESIVNMLLLRTFEQASYSPEPLGHYALASEDYCHFTSPIRRYPDLTVHRLLDRHIRGELRGGRDSADIQEAARELEELGRATSGAERRALTAERTAKNALLLEFMKTKIGETFEGVVSGVVSDGVFVQILRHLADGFIPLSDLGRDAWEHEDRTMRLLGRDSGAAIHLGMTLAVRVEGVDDAAGRLLLRPAGGFGANRPRRASQRTESRARGRRRGGLRGSASGAKRRR